MTVRLDEYPERKLLLGILAALGLPPEVKTQGVTLHFRGDEIPTAEVRIVLWDAEKVHRALLRYHFQVTEVEVLEQEEEAGRPDG